MLTLGWFSTARGQTSPRLLRVVQEAIQRGDFQARIEVIFCNREPGEDPNTDGFLELVKSYGIPLVCYSYTRFRRERDLPPARAGEALPPWRTEYDAEVIRQLEPYPFDLGVLAGYMIIASPIMCQRYDLLNLHPALPGGPKGTWQQVIWQLLEERASHAGVMMHLATPEVDAGPVVTYCTYPIRGPAFDELWREIEGRSITEVEAAQGEGNRLFQEVRRHGVARELPLVVATVGAFARGKVRIVNKQVLDEGGRIIPGYNLTDEIERAVAAAPGRA